MYNKEQSEAIQYIKNLLNDPYNKICADCQRKTSEWASTNLGVFLCIDCSGVHRSLGTHISFVRSCLLDSWNIQQAELMSKIGNKIANEYWEAYLPNDFKRPGASNLSMIAQFIKQKYQNKKWALKTLSPNELIENENKIIKENNNIINHKIKHIKKKKIIEKNEINPNLSLSDRLKKNLPSNNNNNNTVLIKEENNDSSDDPFKNLNQEKKNKIKLKKKKIYINKNLIEEKSKLIFDSNQNNLKSNLNNNISNNLNDFFNKEEIILNNNQPKIKYKLSIKKNNQPEQINRTPGFKISNRLNKKIILKQKNLLDNKPTLKFFHQTQKSEESSSDPFL